ncbi:sensor histidine kinase [Lactococcus nasutitermitis]|uniref:Sensor histidine kinase n=1 Tax=Lactococcus nasutitermitis TaxID=1652957 RepID=A0ABV9JE94_9LACT|nr:sensor histidine kinase [Lactococcus nasutitermitis]
MKKSILTTFTAVFLIIVVVDVLQLLITNTTPMTGMMNQVSNNLYYLWIFLSVAGVLALVFTIFNYVENAKIKQEFTEDVKRLEQNQQPANPELQIVHEKIMNMSNELQELSKQKSVDKAEIIETERKRISRELHDSVSQELFAATMILSSVTTANNLSEEQVMTQTTLVLKVLHEAQNEMRALLLHLRPVELDGKSLVQGLTALTDELSAKISANINIKLSDISASSNIEDNLFRTAQEILSNTLRHSQADNIDVSLNEKYGNIILRIADDGVGFDTSDEKSASYGLANIKERALLLGGDAKVVSAPNQGTIVEVRIPKIEQN